jgi:hypothetical protein
MIADSADVFVPVRVAELRREVFQYIAEHVR